MPMATPPPLSQQIKFNQLSCMNPHLKFPHLFFGSFWVAHSRTHSHTHTHTHTRTHTHKTINLYLFSSFLLFESRILLKTDNGYPKDAGEGFLCFAFLSRRREMFSRRNKDLFFSEEFFFLFSYINILSSLQKKICFCF